MTSLNWLRLEIGVPAGEGDAQLRIDGRSVTAKEFHRELVRLDHAVFVMAMAEEGAEAVERR